MIPAVTASTSSVVSGLPYQWVAAGQNGLLYTSTSTTVASWTSRTSSFGSTNINGIASDGVSQYVAVGPSGKLATSPDGATWTQQTSSFGTTDINAVAYGAGTWVAVGNSGKLATSTNGTTWTQQTSGTAVNLVSIAYGNGLWVAGGYALAITATTPTGTWTSRTSTVTNANFSAYYDPYIPIWVGGQDTGTTTGALASSTDGITWTARNSTINVTGGNACFSSASGIIAMGTTINILTPLSDVQSSTDGVTWTNRTPATTGSSIWALAVDTTGTFVAANYYTGGPFQYSTNGTTWTNGASIVGFSALCLCHSAGTPSTR